MTATSTLPATALADLLLAMADDEFVIGFSDSEWTGIAPLLEEDVAFSSIAQNEIGHARALYELAARDLGTTADELAFDRPPGEYRCSALVAGRAIDDGIQAGDEGALTVIVAVFVASVAIYWGASYAQTYLVGWVGQRALQDLRERIYRHLQAMSIGFFTRRKPGVLISRLTNDVQALDTLVTDGVITLFQSTLILVTPRIIINREETGLDRIADLVLHTAIGDTMGEAVGVN